MSWLVIYWELIYDIFMIKNRTWLNVNLVFDTKLKFLVSVAASKASGPDLVENTGENSDCSCSWFIKPLFSKVFTLHLIKDERDNNQIKSLKFLLNFWIFHFTNRNKETLIVKRNTQKYSLLGNRIISEWTVKEQSNNFWRFMIIK